MSPSCPVVCLAHDARYGSADPCQFMQYADDCELGKQFEGGETFAASQTCPAKWRTGGDQQQRNGGVLALESLPDLSPRLE